MILDNLYRFFKENGSFEETTLEQSKGSVFTIHSHPMEGHLLLYPLDTESNNLTWFRRFHGPIYKYI